MLGELQRAGALGMRVLTDPGTNDTTVSVIRRSERPPEVVAAASELTTLLGLNPGITEYQVRFGEIARDDQELAILTRSTLTIMLELAAQIDVPISHVDEGRTAPTPAGDKSSVFSRLLNVHHATQRPADAFVAVRYRDLWFWFDDRDFRSKRTLAYLMPLFSLTETGGKEGLPLVTIPAG